MPYDEDGGAFVGRRDADSKENTSSAGNTDNSQEAQDAASSGIASVASRLAQTGLVGEKAAGILNNAADTVSAGAPGLIGAISSGIQTFGSSFTSYAKKVVDPITRAGESVSGVLNVSAKIGTTLVCASLASALGIGGVFLWPSFSGEMTADDVAIYSARVKKDCKEALVYAETYYGEHGDYAIPEKYNGIDVGLYGSCEGTFPRISADFGHGSYDRTHGSWAGFTWELYCHKNGISDIHAVNEADMSGVNEYGFSMIDDAYCIALAPELGGEVSINGGDELIFFFDNGKAIRTIACDAKNPSDPNYTIWGHNNGGGINVLEFLCYAGTGDEAHLDIDTSENVYTRLARSEGWDTVPNRVTSFSYNGPSVEYKEFYGGGSGSLLGGAGNASNAAKRAGYNGALDDCVVTTNHLGYSGDFAYVDFMIDIALDDDWGYYMGPPDLSGKQIDCSALVSLALYSCGYSCGDGIGAYWGMSYPWRHSTQSMYSGFRQSGFEEIDRDDRSEWRYGDILLWSSGGQDGHVAVYLGQDNGRDVFVHATGVWPSSEGAGAGPRDETKTEVCITYGNADTWKSPYKPLVFRINDNVERVEVSAGDRAIIDGLEINPDKSNPDYDRWHSWNVL